MKRSDSVKSLVVSNSKLSVMTPRRRFRNKKELEQSVNRLHRGDSLQVKYKLSAGNYTTRKRC